ncbi:metallophosphoesterase family protein [Deinococcus misasensis]|uniref:metallophosphoesterase family protein n=1 Tax=Deinococcus misasensis TaxID=392413 RepID=UPI0012FB9EF9|nr:metallophosphoesterase [Deinococcus misasensis]
METITHPLTFLHLSDIHFKAYSEGEHNDLDSDLRQQLLIDAENLLDKIENIDGVLISGDIAFSGSEKEYEIASDWLKRLCNTIGCEESKVWVVPGNHDINRRAIQDSPMLQDLHNSLRLTCRTDIKKLDDKLRGFLRDRNAELLLSPLREYNSFALKYECITTANKLFWDSEDFQLNAGYRLRIRGANSALISSHLDNSGDNKLIVGEVQAMIPNEDGVIYIFMCHHPFNWIYEWDNIEDLLINRSAIQIYGHKHDLRLDLINGKSVRLASGALHPSRNEDSYDPRYNLIRIDIESTENHHNLLIEVWERQWNKRDRSFQAVYQHANAGKEYRSFKIPLQPLRSRAKIKSEKAATPFIELPLQGEAISEEVIEVQPKRDLVYQFMSLSYINLISFALEHKLLLDTDSNLPEIDLKLEIFNRAEKTLGLYKIWEELSKLSPHNFGNDNPFERKN